ncbi:hypothetical protein ABPG73_020504 [Tetrahymena malaccensis]
MNSEVTNEMQIEASEQANQEEAKQNIQQQEITNQPVGNTFIQEGYAKIQKSYIENSEDGKKLLSEVFYNPVQVFNRDLTVLVIHMFKEHLKETRKEKFDGITILDALSASGLRAIRFSKELQDIKKVYANDISEAAHKLMMDNFVLNNLDLSKIEMTLKDAVQLMYEQKFKSTSGDRNARFDVIDLDPYGTCAPFLDCAIQGAVGETLLCITSTDSRILCGPDTQKCYYLYGSSRAKIAAYEENAVRIILYTANSIANRYGKFITPLLCYMSEFYVRIFLIIKPGKLECGRSLVRTGNVFHCDNCQNQYFQTFGKQSKAKQSDTQKHVPQKMNLPVNICNQCGDNFTINGPIWTDKMNDQEFIQKTIDYLNSDQFNLPLATKKKIEGMLHSIQLVKQNYLFNFQISINIQQEQKAGVDHIPLGYNFEHLSKMMKTTVPGKKKIFSAIKSLNYSIEQTYLNPAIYKTNAPSEIVFDVVRNWKRTLQPNDDEFYRAFDKESSNYSIVSKPNICQPNFDLDINVENKLPRWLPNPEKNWGPGKRPAQKLLVEEGENEQQIEQEDKDNGDELKKKNKTD